MSFHRLLDWLYTGSCDFNSRVGLSASRGAAKLADTEMLEVLQLADQYCLTELVSAIEVQLSERIITKLKAPTTAELKFDSQLEQVLDELVG